MNNIDKEQLPVLLRSKSLDDIVGQDAIVNSLKSKINEDGTNSLPKVYLFSGEPGCGKTNFAYVIKSILDCHDEDFKAYNMKTQGKIDVIRDLEEKMNYRPGFGPVKIYLFDEIQEASEQSISGLLAFEGKIPPDCYFIFCTSEKTALLKKMKGDKGKAFLRRCADYVVKPLNQDDTDEIIFRALDHYELKRDHFDNETMDAIDDASNGSAGTILKNVEKVVRMQDKKDILQILSDSSTEIKPDADARELGKMVLKGKSWKEIAEFLKVLKKSGDPEKIAAGLRGWFSICVLNDYNSSETKIAVKVVEELSCSFYGNFALFIVKIYKCCK